MAFSSRHSTLAAIPAVEHTCKFRVCVQQSGQCCLRERLWLDIHTSSSVGLAIKRHDEYENSTCG